MPTTQGKYSESNVQNSVATLLAGRLLAEGYLLYWHQQDGVQTPDGYYGQWSARQAALLADPTVAARVAAAKGLVTLLGPLTANPRFVTRPTGSGAVEGQDEVPVPSVAIEVGSAAPHSAYELGTRQKWRRRHLVVFAFARDRAEQARLADWLAEWLDEDATLDVLDHDAGDLSAVGPARLVRPAVESGIEIEGPEATTYAVELNATLEYVA